MHLWNILISSDAQCSFYHPASLQSLRRNKVPPLRHWVVMLGLDAYVVVMISVLDMYVKLERMGDACKAFDAMPEKDTTVWNSMITGFARAGLFAKLQFEHGETDAMAIPSVLSVCGKGGELRGKEAHGRVIGCSSFSYDVVIANSLIEMYGCVDDSYKVLCESSQQYIALCGIYEMMGMWDDAAKLRARMRELDTVKTPAAVGPI